MKSPRFWAVMLLMVLAEVLLLHRGNVDAVVESKPLTEFPEQMGSLAATDIPIDPGTLETLGKGFFLNRIYRQSAGMPSDNGSAPMPPVSLFIAYFPTQRSGQSIHSPQNCLPGSGWSFDSSGTTTVQPAGGKAMQVGEYLISNGLVKAEVLYWYQSHGRSIANDYKAKFYMLSDSIRLNRTDAALVRIVTAIEPGESRDLARNRAVSFATRISPLLPSYIPD